MNTLAFSIFSSHEATERMQRTVARARFGITGVSETSLPMEAEVPPLATVEIVQAPTIAEPAKLVASAISYMNALAVLPTDAEYEARVDALLAKRDGGIRKKLNLRKVR